MLTSRSLIAKCVELHRRRRDGRDDVEVHALPLFHFAQLHCFLDRRHQPRRDERHPARGRPGRDAGGGRAPAGDEAVLPADGLDRAAAPPRLRPPRPALAAQGLLRRRRSCRSRCCASSAAPARRAPVQLLRPDRDVAAGDGAAPGGPGPQGRLGRAAGAQRRDARRRRRGPPTSPPGEVGEIVHRCPHAMLGYWDDPEKTAETFRGGWFHSRRPRHPRRRGLRHASSTARRT